MISSTRASCCNNQELHQLSSLLSSPLSMIGAHRRGAFRDPIPSHPFTFIFCTCISDDVLAPSIWHTTRTFHKLEDKKEDKDKDKDNERGWARPKVTKRGLPLVHFSESEENFPSFKRMRTMMRMSTGQGPKWPSLWRGSRNLLLRVGWWIRGFSDGQIGRSAPSSSWFFVSPLYLC